MDFINTIQQNMGTALLFWTCFMSSIITSQLYQKRRVKYSNGSKIERPISKILQVFWISLIVLAPTIIVGVRHFNVGADTYNYWISFLNTEAEGTFFQNFKSSGLNRPLFFIFQYLVFNIFGGNPTFFLIFIAFITLYTLVKALDRWISEISMPMGLFVYYSIFGMQLLNQSRQMLALSFFFLAVTMLMKDNKRKYYLYLIISISIHFSALIGIIMPFIYFRRDKYNKLKKWMYYLVWAVSPLLISPVLSSLSRFMPQRYMIYVANLSLDEIGFGLLLNIMPVFVPLLLFNKYLRSHSSQFLVRVSYLTFPLRLAGYYSYYLMRMYYYGAIFVIILIPIILEQIRHKSNKILAFFIFVGLCMIYFIVNYLYVNNQVLFPYFTIFSQ